MRELASVMEIWLTHKKNDDVLFAEWRERERVCQQILIYIYIYI